MDVHLFDQVAEAVRSLVPDELGSVRSRAHRRGVKIWFGDESPPREHFEAQLMPRRHVDGRDGMVIEIGFHAEHRDVDQNIALVSHLERCEKRWRTGLGPQAEIGVFFGADTWRRVSETWIEPDLDEPELVFEVAARLVDYATALEPVLGEA